MGTGYKNKNVYRVAEGTALGKNVDSYTSAAGTAGKNKFTVSAAKMKRIRAWCKTYGMPTEKNSAGENCYKVRVAASVGVYMKNGTWSHLYS